MELRVRSAEFRARRDVGDEFGSQAIIDTDHRDSDVIGRGGDDPVSEAPGVGRDDHGRPGLDQDASHGQAESGGATRLDAPDPADLPGIDGRVLQAAAIGDDGEHAGITTGWTGFEHTAVGSPPSERPEDADEVRAARRADPLPRHGQRSTERLVEQLGRVLLGEVPEVAPASRVAEFGGEDLGERLGMTLIAGSLPRTPSHR